MFGIATVPAILLALGMVYCPESPRWLYKVGHGSISWEYFPVSELQDDMMCWFIHPTC